MTLENRIAQLVGQLQLIEEIKGWAGEDYDRFLFHLNTERERIIAELSKVCAT